MKRALLVLIAACGAQQPAPTPVIASAAPSHAASSAAEIAPPAPPTTRDRIVHFASTRGGLHGEPVRMPYRNYDLRGAECWLFFVGGDVAHAAWLATPWDPAWGKASTRLPHVDAVVQSPLLEDGVVFERVTEWPRAVRVVSTSETKTGVVVSLESLAARDQPAGAKGDFLVEAQQVSGSLPEASPVKPQSATFDEKKAAAALRTRALAPNAELAEVWQKGLFRRRPLAAGDVKGAVLDAITIANKSGCGIDGLCTNDEGVGVAMVSDGKAIHIGTVFVAPPPPAQVNEPTPRPVAPDEALVAFRANETAQGTLHPVTSVAVGEKRLLVVRDEKSTYLVERDSAYSRVSTIGYQRFEKSIVEARIEDVTGDGVSDVVLFTKWPKQDGAGTYDSHSEATLAVRSRRIGLDVVRDVLGAEIDMIGARDLDDAVARARSPVHGVTPTKAEACSVLAASSTPAGLLKNATSSARIVSFDEPMQPANTTRVVPVTHATADDALQLKDACGDSSEGGFMCRAGLCGNLDYGLGSIYRFVRERGVLKLETALVYVGS
jgi:hypothetical protein